MHKTRIEWTDLVWNPITGCTRGCEYCYARRFAYRLRGRYGYPKDDPFKPTFHSNRLNEPSEIGVPKKIFTCSMGEMFGENIEEIWIANILTTIEWCPPHTFQILTKYPHIAKEWDYPDNCWIGVSHDGKYTSEDMVQEIKECKAKVRFISLEPFLAPIDPYILHGLDWIIVGAKTGPKPFMPKEEWIERILKYARYHKIPIFLKNNLKWKEKVQEWPEVRK